MERIEVKSSVEDHGTCIGCNEPIITGQVLTVWDDEIGHYDCKNPYSLQRQPDLDEQDDVPKPCLLLGEPARYVSLTDIEEIIQRNYTSRKRGSGPGFEREERYITIKRKHLGNDANLAREKEDRLRAFLESEGIDTVECVVIESDWQCFEAAWALVEAEWIGRSKHG